MSENLIEMLEKLGIKFHTSAAIPEDAFLFIGPQDVAIFGNGQLRIINRKAYDEILEKVVGDYLGKLEKQTGEK